MAGVENLPNCQDEVDGPNAGPTEIYEPALDEANKFVSAMESSSKIEDKRKEEYSLPQEGVESVSSASSDREYVEETTENRSSEVITSVEETTESRSSREVNRSVEEINGGISCKVDKSLEEETIGNKSCVTNSKPSVVDNDVDSNFPPVLHETDDSSNKAKLNMQVVEETNESINKSCDDDSVEETNNGSQSCDVTLVVEISESKSVNNESVTETPVNSLCDTSVLSTPTPSYVTPLSNTDIIDPGATPTPSYVTPLSNMDNIDPGALSRVSISFDFERPRDQVITVTLPDTKHCPAYALVLCAWSNILGPHAQYVWQTEGKHNFTPDMMSYLSTHTLTSSDQPQNTVDTKMLILKDRGIIVTSFLFSGYDGDEKTVFSLSLVVPYIDRHWYLPLHEFCVSRLNMMIGRLRVLQDKYKEERGDRAIEKFAEDVPKFIGVLTLLKTSSPGSKIQLQNTVFAVDRALDVQFTRMAIASHLQTCGCSIVIGNSVSEINLMISTLATFLNPAERRCCVYLGEDGQSQGYEKDLYLQGFLKDSINLSECMREIMVSTYPSSLVDMTTLEVRQMLPCNEHAYWRHEVLCHELQSLWLDSQEPMVYLPIVTFQNKSETETLVQNFQREINLLHPHSGVRDAYIEQFQRLLDRKAVGLIKYVEEETMKGSKTSRITIKKLKHDLDLNPEGNFRIILARAEKLKPGIFTVVCGNPAQMRDPSLQELPMS